MKASEVLIEQVRKDFTGTTRKKDLIGITDQILELVRVCVELRNSNIKTFKVPVFPCGRYVTFLAKNGYAVERGYHHDPNNENDFYGPTFELTSNTDELLNRLDSERYFTRWRWRLSPYRHFFRQVLASSGLAKIVNKNE